MKKGVRMNDDYEKKSVALARHMFEGFARSLNGRRPTVLSATSYILGTVAGLCVSMGVVDDEALNNLTQGREKEKQ
jgi:hypothetical protein